jgi:hypothetical protein
VAVHNTRQFLSHADIPQHSWKCNLDCQGVTHNLNSLSVLRSNLQKFIRLADSLSEVASTKFLDFIIHRVMQTKQTSVPFTPAQPLNRPYWRLFQRHDVRNAIWWLRSQTFAKNLKRAGERQVTTEESDCADGMGRFAVGPRKQDGIRNVAPRKTFRRTHLLQNSYEIYRVLLKRCSRD